MKIFIIFSLLLAVSASASTWEELRTQYFPMLNYRVPQERLKLIIDFEKEMNALAEAETLENERLGLIYIYDALLMMNNTKAIKEKVLPDYDSRSLKERAQYAIDRLVRAQELRPLDKRIDSWISGARQSMLSLDTEVISDQALQEALNAIPLRPTFNLWTAMLLFRTQESGTPLYGKLITEAKSFVDALANGSPCALNPEDCRNGVNAPFNIQASLMVLGDTFLRQGEFFLKTGDIGNAMEMLSYSKGTYEQTLTPENSPLTNQWSDRAVIKLRMDYVEKLLVGKKPLKRTLKQMPHYSRPYECASCHGR